jgi:hypothetical protein
MRRRTRRSTIQDLNGIADQSVSSVVSLSVLEHVVDPLRAVHQCTTCVLKNDLREATVQRRELYRGV